MTYDGYELIAFHSRVMTWEPGDILLSGTPGAVVIKPGDTIGCEVAEVGRLANPVAALPKSGVAMSRGPARKNGAGQTQVIACVDGGDVGMRRQRHPIAVHQRQSAGGG